MQNIAHNNRAIVLAVTTALASTMLAGCTTTAAPPANLSADKAQTAMVKGKTSQAIAHAEASVLAEPRNAAYRAMLGATYMEAGRFRSAARSFADAMELGDGSGRTALSYSLAAIAAGDHPSAVSVLNQYRSAIDASDLGLALSLAGYPEQGVHILGNALRGGQTTPKIRQNLAYSYALMGNWRAARLMAAEDVPADELGQRMAEWAALTGPEAHHARVAALLNVPVIGDAGQPARLALSNTATVPEMAGALVQSETANPATANSATVRETAFAADTELPPVSVPMVSQGVPSNSDYADAPIRSVPVPVTVPAATSITRTADVEPRTFAKAFSADEVRATRSAPNSRAAERTAKPKPAVAAKSGDHLIQLGSFLTEQSAKRAWGIYAKRYPQLSEYEMVITQARVRGKTYFRVSAGGFQRASAAAMCRTVKADSHGCIAWAANAPLPGAIDRGVRMASR